MRLLPRLLSMLLLMWVAASCAFVLSAVAPEPVDVHESKKDRDERHAEEGRDRPLVERYARWLGGALTGDLGRSTLYRQPVGPIVLQRAGNSRPRHPAPACSSASIGSLWPG